MLKNIYRYQELTFQIVKIFFSIEVIIDIKNYDFYLQELYF